MNGIRLVKRENLQIMQRIDKQSNSFKTTQKISEIKRIKKIKALEGQSTNQR
jgi:hypothetical protein